MTKVFTINSKNRILPGPSGMGPKVVSGHMTIEPASGAVHASDVELNTINVLLIEQNTLGSITFVDLVAPGSYNNYASLLAYNYKGTVPVARAADTQGMRFLAIGE